MNYTDCKIETVLINKINISLSSEYFPLFLSASSSFSHYHISLRYQILEQHRKDANIMSRTQNRS